MKRVLSMLLVLLLVFSMVACDLSSLGGTGSSSQGGGQAKQVKVSFKAFETGATIIGASTLTVNEGETLNWTEVPSAVLREYEFVGWAYDVDGNRMLDIISDRFYSDTVLVAIFAPVGQGGASQGGSGNVTDGCDKEEGTDVTDSSTSTGNGSDVVDSSDPITDNSQDVVDSSNKETEESGEVDTPTDSTTDGSDEKDEEDVEEYFYVNFRPGNSNAIVVGDKSLEILKGSILTFDMAPSVTLEGYSFAGWSFTPLGTELWDGEDIVVNSDVVLYAVWEKNSTEDDNTEKPEKYVVIEYDVGPGGSLDNSNDYEVEIGYGTRYTNHPTPSNYNPAMLFTGWYADAACTVPVSNSKKYTEDVTVLYAGWYERERCVDGSFDHEFSSWDIGSNATCTESGTSVRYCVYCSGVETKVSGAPLGHLYGYWTETFMAKERTCQRLGCGNVDRVEYKNVTLDVLGNNPVDQIYGNTSAFYSVPFVNLINNVWNESYANFVCPRGNGEAYVQFDFVTPTVIDRIYFGGNGVTAINVYVLYEGESDFVLVGICGSATEESVSFCEPAQKKIVAVKFVESNPPQATSQWHEIAFVKIDVINNENGDNTSDDVEEPSTGKVTIEYEVGVGGAFDSLKDYEVIIDYGTRYNNHPTPFNKNPAKQFTGWYTDPECTTLVSNSTKYTKNTVLYAGWYERYMCVDGTYNHNYYTWEEEVRPTCTSYGTNARYCMICNGVEYKKGEAPLGHKFGSWQETFMAKERICQRLGCGETETVNFKNVTTTILGNVPAEQIEGNTEAFYDVPFTKLINNKWDESFGQYVGPRGNGAAYVQFNFKEATSLDRIYFKGEGVTSINAYVLYEGEDEFRLLGVYGSASEKENTPFYEPDSTRKIVAVKFVEENPPQGTSMWQEVAFVKTDVINNENGDNTSDDVEEPSTGKVTIEYEVGAGGRLESIEDYEVIIDYGTRYINHPTPTHQNQAMLFTGWYTDSECTTLVSNSTKYTKDTVLYAGWYEQEQCSDGSYDHLYSAWEDDKAATCVNYGTRARYCLYCNSKQTAIDDAPLGHKFGSWQEAFMAKERVCQRLGCGETEKVNFKNITTTILGNAPAEQIEGNTEAFYDVPFTNLINNKWDDSFGQAIFPRGNGEAYVQFNFKEATTLDRIYFKGKGVTSINAYVLYEGEDEFQLLGIYGSASEKEDTPFCEPDSTRKIVAVKFVEENPPQGTSMWQEVAFVKVSK